jgi:hypothetical protein
MSQILLGLWYDNSQPSVLGWTLTLPVDEGTILLSALTLLVTIAGSSTWSLAASLIHSLLARRGQSVNAVDLQYQVALRNSSGALSTVLDSLKIHQAWSRVKTPRLWGRTLAVSAPALLIWGGFALASILTSKVANRGYNSVLARSIENNCGTVIYQGTSHDQIAAFSTKAINDTSQARNYAMNFYIHATSTPTARSIVPVARLPVTVDTAAACPAVNTTRCSQGHNSAISMKTDFLDSHTMLGINAKPSDRVTVQLRTTCAMVYVGDRMFVNGSVLEYDLGPMGSSPLTYLYNMDAFRDWVGYQIW